MSKYFYSASARGFYVDSIHGAGMPSDIVEIPEGEWRGLLEAQATGSRITPDESGRPVAVLPNTP